jgi:Periplasmic protein involved in polysaccharide export
MEYLQQYDRQYSNPSLPDYKLKPNDELYIQISSLDDAAATITTSAAARPDMMGSISPYGASLLSHKIDKEGYVELPVIGKLQVKDKTIGEVKTMIKDALANVLNQPIVSIKLVNTFITILGEVKLPGHYVYSEEKLSVFDALGLAGDITEFGDRKSVVLIRNENGINVRRNLDLLKSDILGSDYYYVRPGDVIYVRPLRSRAFPFANVLTAVSTTILVLSFIKTNIK